MLVVGILTWSYFSIKSQTASISHPQEFLIRSNSNSPYRFHDPFIAYHLLDKLDTASVLPKNTTNPKFYRRVFNGIALNDNYCKEHRAHFANYPEVVFDHINLVSDFWTNHQLKLTSLKELHGVDVQPEISFNIIGKPENRKDAVLFKYPPSLDANIYFFNNPFHSYRLIGKEFGCLSQVYNHIPGSVNMLRKDYVGNTIAEYTQQYASKPQCFDNSKFFPQTYVLWKQDHCEEFFKYFNSPAYAELKKERGVVFLRKISTGVHQGKGVFPLTEEAEQNLTKEYENGALCGKNANTTVIQKLIHNPLLLEGRKFDFRVYMLVASTNPMISYFYDGYLRISLSEYDPNSKEKNTFVTNIVLNHDVFDIAEKNGTYKGMTKKEMEAKTCWWFDDLQKYLTEQGRITDPDWLNNHLRAQMKKIMIHLTRMAELSYAKQSSLSELYGIDLMLDDNLDVWFIELNTMPLIAGWNPVTKKFFNNLMKDYFEIEYGLLRSRMKRVIDYINILTKEKSQWKVTGDGIEIKNFKAAQKEFEKVSMNYFEDEFKPSEKNGFQLIVDHNLQGPERYAGYLLEECF